MLHRFLRCQQQAEHVQVELFVVVLFGNAFERRELVNACVVHEHIELAERLFRFRKETIDVRLLRDIRLYRDGPAAVLRNLTNDPIRSLFAGRVVDDHRRAFRGQLFGDLGADALGCSCDDRHFSCKFFRAHNISSLVFALMIELRCGRSNLHHRWRRYAGGVPGGMRAMMNCRICRAGAGLLVVTGIRRLGQD